MQLKTLWISPKKWQLACVCGLLGALSFFAVFGVATLDVTNDGWVLAGYPEADIVQNYAGWMAYRNTDWGFPLSYTNAFLWPQGTLVAYTDSNPLLSAFFKLLSPLLPATFQYYGWYTLACFVLQGVAAGLLLRLFMGKAWQVYAATLLFTFAPVFIERANRHVQLASHFLILFALYLYFTMRREGYTRLRWQFILLNALAVGIHPYFLPMVMMIFVVALVEYLLRTRRFARAAGALAANLAAALGTGWVFGLIGWQSGGLSRTGYGFFSMNLNALFNPLSVGDYQWSYVLGRMPQDIGQMDSFNFLGLGVLIMACMVVLHWLAVRAAAPRPLGHMAADAWRCLRLRWPLLAACALLTVFAVTNVVVLHDKTLLSIPLPDFMMQLCGIFRASGRLFWPVYYLIILALLRYIARHIKPGAAGLLVGAMVVVQLLDISGAVRAKHEWYASRPAFATITDDALIAEKAPRYSYFIALEDLSLELHYRYMAMVGHYGLKSNIGIVNTGDSSYALQVGDAARQSLLQGAVDVDAFYIVKDPALAQQLRQALQGQDVLFYEAEGYYFLFPQAAG